MANTVATITQPATGDSRTYAGSRYSELVAAIFANPYQPVWGAPGAPPLPVHEVSYKSVAGGLIPRQFQRASEIALDSQADMTWGADGKGFRRLVHPNGICLTGRWSIDQDTAYSGYFRKGSEALVVARYSTC